MLNLNINIVLFQAALLAVQGVSYLLIQQTKRPVHDMAKNIDGKISLVPQWIFIYVLWYPLLVVFPLTLYGYDDNLYWTYILSIVIDIGISLIVYWFYPTTFSRPEVSADTLSGRFLRLLYIADYKGLNCMPSMHCSMCFIIIGYALICNPMGLWVKLLFIVVSCGIVVSTLFTKQHVLLDVIAALGLALICLFAASLF